MIQTALNAGLWHTAVALLNVAIATGNVVTPLSYDPKTPATVRERIAVVNATL